MALPYPQVVPLPEVSKFTDQIVFGNLGLPVGFDTERLDIHLRSLEIARVAGGLGRLSVTGSREQPSIAHDVEVDFSGTAASLGKFVSARK